MVTTLTLKHRTHTDHEAVDAVRLALKHLGLSGNRVLVVIHGYGSTGVGGSNRDAIRTFLTGEQAAGRVRRLIPGERLSRGDVTEWKRRYNGHSSTFDSLTTQIGNAGVTVVEG